LGLTFVMIYGKKIAEHEDCSKNQIRGVLMKVQIFAILFLAGAQVQAINIECKVIKMHDTSFLEESLSKEEYPDVSVTDHEASLGSSSFEIQDGDKIETLPAIGFNKTVKITQKGGAVYTLHVDASNPRKKRGTLFGKERGHVKASKIADLSCD